MAYNSTKNKVTQFTPNLLFLGREVRLPVDLAYGLQQDDRHYDDYNDFVHDLVTRQQHDFATARQNLGLAAQSRKAYYDVHIKPSDKMKVDDLVWYYYPRKYKGRCNKWNKYYVGPMKVIRVIDQYNFVIQKTANSKPMVVHRDKLKTYHPPDPAWQMQTPQVISVVPQWLTQ